MASKTKSERVRDEMVRAAQRIHDAEATPWQPDPPDPDHRFDPGTSAPQAHAREVERVKRTAAEDQAMMTKSLQDQVTVLQAQAQQLQLDNARMSAAGVSSQSELAQVQLEREVQRAQLATSQQLNDQILSDQLVVRLAQAKASVKSEVDDARQEAERANQLAVEALEAAQEMALREKEALRESELGTPLVPLRRGSPSRRARSPMRAPERGSPPVPHSLRAPLQPVNGSVMVPPAPQPGLWDPTAQEMVAQLQQQLIQQGQILQQLQMDRKEPGSGVAEDAGVGLQSSFSGGRSPRQDAALEHVLERSELQKRDLEMQLSLGMQYVGQLERELEVITPPELSAGSANRSILPTLSLDPEP